MKDKKLKDIVSSAGSILGDDSSSAEERRIAGHILSKSDDGISVSEAVKVLTQALSEDKEFYFAYQSNIAMAIYDEVSSAGYSGEFLGSDLANVSNNAAKRFLDKFIDK